MLGVFRILSGVQIEKNVAKGGLSLYVFSCDTKLLG